MRTLVLTGLLFLLPTCVLADWGLPTNLGPLVNSDADEFGLSLSNDGAILYFDSDRPGGVGGKDLYLSRRSGGQWQGAENLGPQVNTSAREYCPSVSPDGLQLLFTTEGFNIHVSTFDGEQWLAGETLGPPVNTPAPEWAARFGAVAETIYFTAFEREPGTGHDILSSIRIGQAWGTPASLGFNSAAHEYAPFVVAGADSMLLVVDGDIHVSHWDGSAWTPPTVLPGGINHPDYYDTCPLSERGHHLLCLRAPGRRGWVRPVVQRLDRGCDGR